MKVLKMTPATQSEERSVPEDLQQILEETGFNLTGMDPTVIKKLAASLRRDFTRCVLRGEEEVA